MTMNKQIIPPWKTNNCWQSQAPSPPHRGRDIVSFPCLDRALTISQKLKIRWYCHNSHLECQKQTWLTDWKNITELITIIKLFSRTCKINLRESLIDVSFRFTPRTPKYIWDCFSRKATDETDKIITVCHRGPETMDYCRKLPIRGKGMKLW